MIENVPNPHPSYFSFFVFFLISVFPLNDKLAKEENQNQVMSRTISKIHL